MLHDPLLAVTGIPALTLLLAIQLHKTATVHTRLRCLAVLSGDIGGLWQRLALKSVTYCSTPSNTLHDLLQTIPPAIAVGVALMFCKAAPNDSPAVGS